MPSHTRRARLSALTAAVAGLAAAATTALAPPAKSAPLQPQVADCPAAYTVAELEQALSNGPVNVTGLTVSTGTTPETFDAQVLGVVQGGIAAGIDMIMIEATSGDPATIGIWSGMSGSPCTPRTAG